MRRYPKWLIKPFSPDGTARAVGTLIKDLNLVTVCESALCPNLNECYSQRQLTFMILGNRCTRSCRFCAVEAARPEPVAEDEPERIAQAVQRLKLRHVVVTSVARDDLQDEGVGQFVKVIQAVRRLSPGITIEVLVPDFHGRPECLSRILEEGFPEVFAHNVETIERLSPLLRPQARYRRSLEVLHFASTRGTSSLVKSGLMVGLGETEEELIHTFDEMVEVGVTHLTIGQYLRPDADHLPVMEYISPQRFQEYSQIAYAHGLRWVKAGPFVRSSYHAVDALHPTTVHANVNWTELSPQPCRAIPEGVATTHDTL